MIRLLAQTGGKLRLIQLYFQVKTTSIISFSQVQDFRELKHASEYITPVFSFHMQ